MASPWIPRSQRQAPPPFVGRRALLLQQYGTRGSVTLGASVLSEPKHEAFLDSRSGSAVSTAPRAPPAVHFAPLQGSLSASEIEAARRDKYRDEFIALLAVDLKNCESLVRKLEGSKFMQDHLKLLLAWQPDTLRKHLSGWKRWSAYCRSCSWNAGNPGLGQFCDYLHIVLEGIDEDRDVPAFGTVAGIISAVRFVADKLDVPCLNDVVRCAAVDGFINAKPATIKREAPPLAAAMVAAMEQAVTQGVLQPFQTLVVGYFLLLVWASLRFGDGQRTRPASLVLECMLLRGECWRTKSSKRGQPFGAFSCGLTSRPPQWGWTHVWFSTLQSWIQKLEPCARDKIDFLLPVSLDSPSPMSLESGMKHLISIMSSVAPSFDWSQYTTHSSKTTLLAWSKQLDLPAHWRAAQGHHRLPDAHSGCVAEYGREDVEDALCCQQALLLKLDQGWIPRRAQMRGAGAPLQEPAFALPQTRLTSDMFNAGNFSASDFDPALPSDIWQLDAGAHFKDGSKRSAKSLPREAKVPKLDREIWRAARGLF